MPVIAQGFAVLAALLHIVFFVLESVLFTRPAIYARFGVASQADAETIRPMAYNQGFYNLALALGILGGLILRTRGGELAAAGTGIVLFACACIVLAGVVLLTTGRHFLRSALIQLVPPLLALLLTAIF